MDEAGGSHGCVEQTRKEPSQCEAEWMKQEAMRAKWSQQEAEEAERIKQEAATEFPGPSVTSC